MRILRIGLASMTVLGLQVPAVTAGNAAAGAGKWESIAGPSRFYHTATSLKDGRVLVAGGCEVLDESDGCRATKSATVYNPQTRQWSAAASMATPRMGHVAVGLPDGRLMVIGGCAVRGPFLCSQPSETIELFEPRKNRWSPAPGSNPKLGFLDFQSVEATLIPEADTQACFACGKVLLASLSSQHLIDPKDGRVTPAKQFEGQFPTHQSHTVLADRRVLVISPDMAVVYDSRTDGWAAAPLPKIPRFYHTITPLEDGRALAAGGLDAAQSSGVSATELFIPAGPPGPGAPETAKDSWAPAREMATARFGHTAVRLAGGNVLVAGGSNRLGEGLSEAELYNVASGKWLKVSSMAAKRGGQTKGQGKIAAPASFTATVVSDGTVLTVGGTKQKTSDIYIPADSKRSSPAEPRRGAEPTPTAWIAAGGGGVLALAAAWLFVRKRGQGRA